MLKLKLQYFGHLMQRTDSLEKTMMLGKIEGWRRRGWQRNKMVGWHHRLNGHGFGWTPGVGDGQGSLACCSSWGRKESPRLSDWTEYWIEQITGRKLMTFNLTVLSWIWKAYVTKSIYILIYWTLLKLKTSVHGRNLSGEWISKS